ncbi:TIGR03663 family protein [candidate division KSB1 bacterium]|nr:TIGR03663 family protein [candidate division KSB1 bacterium]
MSRFLKIYLLYILLFFIAAAIRLPQLNLRPMHTDEAVHGIKFGALLDEGYYRYDKNEYHGPTLNYFTLFPAWIRHQNSIDQVSERTLRLVPVFFGLGLILLLLPLVRQCGWTAVTGAAFFTALSPFMVFYSRYYIQEILLVFFTFGLMVSGWRYIQNRHWGWMVAAGAFAGFMYATKETWVIAAFAIFAASALLVVMDKQWRAQVMGIRFLHLFAGFFTAIFVVSLFFSSFLTNMAGIWDSVLAYKTYFTRASANDWHLHPWYFYFKKLLCPTFSNGLCISEWVVVVFSAIGIWHVFRYKNSSLSLNFFRLTALYALISAVIYALIPYKTPWCLLGFYHGFIVLAGYGLAVSLQWRVKGRFFVYVTLGIGVFHLIWSAWVANYKMYDDPANPCVYAHTSRDVFAIVNRIKEYAAIHEDGQNMYIEVICPGGDYWPFPWYLRACHRVGWWSAVDENVPAAPVILAKPEIEADLLHKLYVLPPPGEKNLYLPMFQEYKELRPGVEIRGYVVKELWDEFEASTFR